MILLTGLYYDPDPGRRAELLECLQRNIEADRLDEIHLFVEDPTVPEDLRSHPALNSAKVRLIAHGRRVTFRDLFAYATQQLPGRAVIIANADIFFDHTLARLDGYDLSGQLFCLSRWDVQPDRSVSLFDHHDSQDAWIFQAPIRDFPCDFNMGVLGCDNRLAWEAENAGLIISNPCRSLRANHLHLSEVRRFSERLAGETRVVPSKFLGTPWLWFVVPCMGRLDDLRQTIPSLLTQKRSSYVLVDYSCPDDAGVWVHENYPAATVVEVAERTRFKGAEARNRGAAAVDGDGILCFLDADVSAAPAFSEHVLNCFEEGSYLVPDRSGPGVDSALVCSKAAHTEAQGFDEMILDWGDESTEMKTALARSGVAERSFPASLLSHRGHHDASARSFRTIRDREISRAIYTSYTRAKSAILEGTGGNGVSSGAMREIYSAIACRHLNEREQTWDLSCAAVAYSETMGYTIARLEPGASSHNNELRPFTLIPELLRGKQFTQVVSRSVSPVEVEFLCSGKVYVLVGNDWEGYHLATSWLRRAGCREGLPLVKTQPGPAFEVWSLAGERGEQLVLPTQVMLVADRIVRK
ncbi:MAG TPA: glycosyltransferase family A protein [Pyrinomonadaceae bacterium]|nr:glycosyltransferase family A protein [Pyrinomonadaceae bacterium]